MCRESSTSAASTTDPPTNQPTKELNWNGGWRDAFRQWRAIAASIALPLQVSRFQRINVQTHNRNRGGLDRTAAPENLMTKNKCIESISTSLMSTSRWREALQEKHPDHRNARSAKLLAKLANESEHWAVLEPYFKSDRWQECLRQEPVPQICTGR